MNQRHMPVVTYLRVSTDEQGDSGLGLEAQRCLVEEYSEQQGYRIDRSYTEIATAKGRNLGHRPVLQDALKHAESLRSKVVVAKLDRLSRDVAFISQLMARKVAFEVAELGPGIDPFMLHIHAAVGEHERRLISTRTKAALAALKERGVTLGNPSNLREAGLRGANRQAQAAQEIAEGLRSVFQELEGESLRQIAEVLNARRIPTARGGAWHASQVGRIKARLLATGKL